MTPRDWQSFFKPEDFYTYDCSLPCYEVANAILREELKNAVTIYKGINPDTSLNWVWTTAKYPEDTHSAKIVDVKEIK